MVAALPHDFARLFPHLVEGFLVVGVERDQHAVANAFAYRIPRLFALGAVNESGTGAVGGDIAADQALPGAV